jgi:uncharacterized 2Fe-2S/4Fe-4S cluster protein (DUF4445 family)
LVLGLVPDCDVDRVEAVGNAAGVGALMLLLSAGARGEIERVAAEIVKVETAIEPAFQEHFVAAMAFPHAHLPYPRLAERITLPPPTAPPARTAHTRRRRNLGNSLTAERVVGTHNAPPSGRGD